MKKNEFYRDINTIKRSVILSTEILIKYDNFQIDRKQIDIYIDNSRYIDSIHI